MNANMKKMVTMMAKQFTQLASSSGVPSTFSSQPKMNPKDLISSPSSVPSSSRNVR